LVSELKKTSTRFQLKFTHCKTINSFRYTALAIKPKVDTSLSEYKKSETNPVVFKQKLSELKQSKPVRLTIEIYTDGSKHQGKVAAAAVTKNEIFSARLPNEASIFTAEAKQTFHYLFRLLILFTVN
jgi:hypothetical protein